MGKALILRTCNPDMTSYGGFRWPESGPVEAPDWDGGQKVCGGKLHGFLWGTGGGSLANWGANAKWLVVAVDESDIVDLGGKCGFRGGEVVFCGDRAGATGYILANGAEGKPVVGATVAIGNRGTATAGYRGTATAGYRGTATAGNWGTATTGAGGTATAGDRGTATAGAGGTATAGDWGTATTGAGGTATTGAGGTATAGDWGAIAIQWYDMARGKYRVAVAEVGENGIKPNQKYRVVDGKFVEQE